MFYSKTTTESITEQGNNVQRVTYSPTTLLYITWLFFIAVCIYGLLCLYSIVPFYGLNAVLFVLFASFFSASLLWISHYGLFILLHEIARFIWAIKKPQEPAILPPLNPVFELKNTRLQGHVYLIRKYSDGSYKIGKSQDFASRFKSLSRVHGLIMLIALWEVPDCGRCETMALRMTEDYKLKEENRREFRSMTDDQARKFVNQFTGYVLALDINEQPPDYIELAD